MMMRKAGAVYVSALMLLFCGILSDHVRAETTEVRIAYQHSMTFLVVDVMLGRKFIEARAADAGLGALKVSAVRFSSGPAANEALIKGDVEVGGAGIAPFLDLWSKTRGTTNVRGIAPINNSPLYLISTDLRIQTPKDLTPADKVSVPAPSSVQGLFLRMLSDRTFANPAYLDASMVSMTSPDSLKALQSSNSGIRTYVGSIPFNVAAMALPGAHELANSYEHLAGPHTLVLLFVTEKFKTENPKTYDILVAAIGDAMAFIKSNPQETAEIFSAASNGTTPPALVLDVLRRPDVAYDLTPRGTMAFAAFMQKIGVLKDVPSAWKDVYWESVHDRDGS